jgi:hypothetical protein
MEEQVLRSWLTQKQRRAFVTSRAGNLPYAAASLPVSSSMFDWTLLQQVLQPAPPPDLLIVRSNAVLAREMPRGTSAVRALLQEGAGIVVRRAQERERSLRSLALRFEQEFAADAQIQLFVTAAGTQGFGWHYDLEDVVIIQTLGVKTYYFRANTRQPKLDPKIPPDFTLVREERSPVLGCTLAAGDALYLPRGMWHAARAVEESFSISLGLSPRTAAQAP